MKSGIKTTEFWLTLLAQFAGFAVLFGFATQVEADSILEIVVPVVKAAGILAVQIVALVKYIQSRTELKTG